MQNQSHKRDLPSLRINTMACFSIWEYINNINQMEVSVWTQMMSSTWKWKLEFVHIYLTIYTVWPVCGTFLRDMGDYTKHYSYSF